MTELQRLIREQKADMKSYTINPRKENETLIRPYIFRFQDFPGETPKQKAFAVLKYFGWKSHDILSALQISVIDLCDMQNILQTTTNEEFYDKFFTQIKFSLPRHKAVIILRGLKWTYRDIASALSLKSVANIKRIARKYCVVSKLSERKLYNPRT
jgi:hypothetical protein